MCGGIRVTKMFAHHHNRDQIFHVLLAATSRISFQYANRASEATPVAVLRVQALAHVSALALLATILYLGSFTQ